MKKVLLIILTFLTIAGCDLFEELPEPKGPFMTCGEIYRYRIKLLTSGKFAAVRRPGYTYTYGFFSTPPEADVYKFCPPDGGEGQVTIHSEDTVLTFTWSYEISGGDSCRATFYCPVYVPFVGYRIYGFSSELIDFGPNKISLIYPGDLYPNYMLELRARPK